MTLMYQQNTLKSLQFFKLSYPGCRDWRIKQLMFVLFMNLSHNCVKKFLGKKISKVSKIYLTILHFNKGYTQNKLHLRNNNKIMT